MRRFYPLKRLEAAPSPESVWDHTQKSPGSHPF